MIYQKVFQTNKLDEIILISFLLVWWRNIKKQFKQTKSTIYVYLFASLFDDVLSKVDKSSYLFVKQTINKLSLGYYLFASLFDDDDGDDDDEIYTGNSLARPSF